MKKIIVNILLITSICYLGFLNLAFAHTPILIDLSLSCNASNYGDYIFPTSKYSFRSGDYEHVEGKGCDLIGADLSKANLSGANLHWADLTEADLRWADLRWADLSRAYFTEADLRWADLRWADLSGTYFTDADLIGADLSGTDLSWAKLAHARNLSKIECNSKTDFPGRNSHFKQRHSISCDKNKTIKGSANFLE